MKIWKYELQITDRQYIPVGSSYVWPLSVAEQNGKLMLWAHVIKEDGFPPRCKNTITVDIIGTGNPYEFDMTADNFVGTAVMSYGAVWHVFARYDIISGGAVE